MDQSILIRSILKMRDIHKLKHIHWADIKRFKEIHLKLYNRRRKIKWKVNRNSCLVSLPKCFTYHTYVQPLFPFMCQKKNASYLIHKCVVRISYIPHVMHSELHRLSVYPHTCLYRLDINHKLESILYNCDVQCIPKSFSDLDIIHQSAS